MDKTKMRWFKLILMITFNKKFRHWFRLTVLYALTNYEDKRDDGSSDVLMFDKVCNFTNKILVKESE